MFGWWENVGKEMIDLQFLSMWCDVMWLFIFWGLIQLFYLVEHKTHGFDSTFWFLLLEFLSFLQFSHQPNRGCKIKKIQYLNGCRHSSWPSAWFCHRWIPTSTRFSVIQKKKKKQPKIFIIKIKKQMKKKRKAPR